MARQLKVQYDADASPVQRALQAMQGNIGAFAGNLSGIQKVAAVGFGAVVAGAAAGGVALFKIGEKFDEAYDTIRVGTGATGKTLEGLQSSFKNVVKDVPTDFASAGTAISDLNTRTGLTGKGLENMAKQQLELARITKTDLAGNIAATTRVFGDWGIKTNEQSAALDKMFRTSQATGTGVDKLASSVVQFGAPLRQMGFSFEQSIGLLGKFEKEGVNSELVMGSLRIALGKLAKAGKDPVKAFQQQVQAIKDTGDAGKANALALELFGARAGPDMAAAIREGRFELGDLYKQITSGKDTILGAGKDTMDFAEKWKRLKNQVAVAVEPLAMKVFDGVGKAFDVVGPKIAGFITFVSKVAEVIAKADPGILKFIGSIAAVALPVLGAVLAFNKVVAVIKGLSLALAANPFVLLIAAVIGLTILIVKNWDTIKAAIGAAWEWIKATTSAIWEGIKSFLSAAWEFIKNIFLNATIVGLIIQHWDSIKATTAAIWNGIKNFLSGLWEGIKGAAAAIWNAIVAFLVGRWENLRANVMGIWNGIKNFLSGLWEGIKGAAAAIWNAIVAFLEDSWNGLKAQASAVFSALRGTVEAIWNGIRGAAGAIWNGIQAAVMGPVNAVRSGVESMVNAVVGAWNRLWSSIKGIADKIRSAIKGLPWVPGSPIPLVVWTQATVQGIHDAFRTLTLQPTMQRIIGQAEGMAARVRSIIAGVQHSIAAQAAAPVPAPRIYEDDPRWNPATMGNLEGWKNGIYYRNGQPVALAGVAGFGVAAAGSEVRKNLAQYVPPLAQYLEVMADGLVRVRREYQGFVTLFEDGSAMLESAKLPNWLTPGSPTPLETALVGIKEALVGVERQARHTFDGGALSAGRPATLPTTSRFAGSSAGPAPVQKIYNITVNATDAPLTEERLLTLLCRQELLYGG